MITAMTRSTSELWDGLRADPAWRRLRREGPDACPPTLQLARFLAKHRVRFPRQKAERIRRSLRCDFDGLAREMRRTFADVHDARRDRDRRRRAEVHLAELLQTEFAGCGVAPKIARLALLGAPEVTQVIPIDSRWMNALREAGFEIRPPQLANERRYRFFEDALCEAAYALGVRPTDADGIPFGWLLNEGV